jgi:hypothetical protein
MGRGNRFIKFPITQPEANLCLSDPAIAKNHEFNVSYLLASGCHVLQMSAKGIEAIVA